MEISQSESINPIKINDSYEANNNRNKTLYGNNQSYPLDSNSFLPKNQQRLIFQRQIRSKF
jgi:hypothetical protein